MGQILISLDIDGTLDIGDPPGVLTMTMVRRSVARGFIIGSCSDRPLSAQRALFKKQNIPLQFAVSKHMLSDVMQQFKADAYYHIGDREDLDKIYAERAGFNFLWPDEAILKPWFLE
ncbi:MAG: hypothetical protein KUG79_11435 [Pseudomonadales bacterium]|nr:hypothetical protein [Pseudomonadales bacterium]